MNLKKFTIVPMLAMALFAVGCGADCESVCEDAKECDGADEDADCGKLCEEGQKAAEKAGCEEEWDDFWSCVGGEDVCEPEDYAKACEAESKAMSKCAEG